MWAHYFDSPYILVLECGLKQTARFSFQSQHSNPTRWLEFAINTSYNLYIDAEALSLIVIEGKRGEVK
jgi:hypothetical protein